MAARNPFASSIPDIYDAYAPYSYQRKTLSTGYYVVRNLLIVGALCGGFVALYRNDVLRDLARRVGQEPRYLAAEQFLGGTPGWGTPRSMEPVLAQDGTAPTVDPTSAAAPVAALPVAPSEPTVAAAPTAAAPAAPVAAPIPPPTTEPAPLKPLAAAPVPAPAPAHVAVAAAPFDPLTPVKFESLPLVGQQGPRAVAFTDLPTSHAAAAPAPHAAPAPVAARPAPVTHANSKAVNVSLNEAPAHHAATSRSIPAPSRAAPPPEPKPAPAPVAAKPAPPPGPKPTEARASDNPLLAAVRGAVRTRPAKESVPAAK
jgi:hypothetical protein